MKKFKFKLETVLNVKEKKEEQLKNELLKLLALKAEQQQLLLKIETERKKAHNEKVSETTNGASDIMSFIYYEEYLNLLRKNIEITENNIKVFERKADIKRVEVVEASKEKKIFEKLKGKQHEQFKLMVLQNEQKTLDEIAVSKYNRKEQRSV